MEMTLLNTAEILNQAHNGGYAIPAFNIVDSLTMESVVRAAKNLFSPIIIQTSSGVVKRHGAKNLVRMARTFERTYHTPVSIHMDHGRNLTLIQECIEAGYSSVMIDGSHLPFDENAAITSQVVKMAHYYGLSVEGEIGTIGGKEDEIEGGTDMVYTTPEEAIRFKEITGVDFLAVGVGTVHGFYKGVPRVSVAALKAIRQEAYFPIVIHGGSGLEPALVRDLVKAGGAKFNVSTQVKKTYQDTLRNYLNDDPPLNPLKMLDAAQDALIDMMEDYITLLGSDEKAMHSIEEVEYAGVSM